jgi:hypothetical protein
MGQSSVQERVVVQFDEEIPHILWDLKGSSPCSQNPTMVEVTS